MPRRTAILSLLLAIIACGAGTWATIRHVTSAFIAPGAANIHIAEVGPGEREITYMMPNPDDGWQTAIARRLDNSGWQLARDRFQWGGTDEITVLSTYTRISQFWFFTIRERAELLGDRSSARIKVSYSITTRL